MTERPRGTDSPSNQKRAWHYLHRGYSLETKGDLARSSKFTEKALSLARLMGDPELEASALRSLGHLCLLSGELSRARGFVEEALQLCSKRGSAWGKAPMLLELARIALAAGDYERARRLALDVPPLTSEEAMDLLLPDLLASRLAPLLILARAAIGEGDARAAADVLREAEPLLEDPSSWSDEREKADAKEWEQVVQDLAALRAREEGGGAPDRPAG